MFNFIDKISNMKSDKISEDIMYVIDINALDYEEKTKKKKDNAKSWLYNYTSAGR